MIRDKRICKYPFLNMSVGDSFSTQYEMYKASNIMKTARKFCERNELDWKFRTETKGSVIMVIRCF